MHKKPFYTQVTIIGAGVSGTALLFLLSRYTGVESVALFEKCDAPAMLNSSAKANSQTLHVGDIETNYNMEKAAHVKIASSMVAHFIERFDMEEEIGFRRDKMVMAVGEEEIRALRTRFEKFQTLFPDMEWWGAPALEAREPLLLKGRKEPVAAIGIQNTITTVDFEKLSRKFIALAEEEPATDIYPVFTCTVESIEKKGNKYLLHTQNGTHLTDMVVVDAGPHALLFAHALGYGKELAMLPIGGGFYFADRPLLQHKIYTMQHPKLPFAAVHADPDLTAGWNTRFGPTAFATPKLENRHHVEILNLFDLLGLDRDLLSVYYDLMKDDHIRHFILHNYAYQLPGIGNDFFITQVQKIIPSLQSDDIHYADDYGGIRPQIIDKSAKKLLLGEAKIDTGTGLIFNMTPSPGASSCLGNGWQDAERICRYLDVACNRLKLEEELRV
jgi:malate dehydrogenase (quinone)